MLTTALDYETFYSKTYTIKDLGNFAYCQHPEFDPYMLTCATDAKDLWCGNPIDFDYEAVNGATWVMANAGFDIAVTDRIYELNPTLDVAVPIEIFDVLDLARFLGYPGSLAGASLHMLGKSLDKATRTNAKGKHWNDMTPEFQKEMSTYALRDAQVTLEIWQEYGHLWPELERELSRLTREMCKQGVPVDINGIEVDIKNLKILLSRARALIPWKIEDDGKGALSRKGVAAECAKAGITPPKSMAKDSEEFDEWLRQHGDNHKWARAMGQYRSTNTQLKRLEGMQARAIVKTGWMPFGLKYCGAHTRRDSGDQGVNLQNPSKVAMFEKEMRAYLGIAEGEMLDQVYGIDIRGKIMAPEGKILGVVDLAAIEPCALSVLALDWDLAYLLESGMDPYEAWARVHHGYTDPRPLKDVDTDLRALCKVEVLLLGYGGGPDKLVSSALSKFNMVIDPVEAVKIVADFRKVEFIPALWKKLENGMRAEAPDDFVMELPSGNELRYRDVKDLGCLSAVVNRGTNMVRQKWWGGSLTENLVQAASREVFMDRVLALHNAGLPPVLRVHDEAVCLLDERTADDQLRVMIEIFSTKPDWWSELPIRADGHLCKRYTKG